MLIGKLTHFAFRAVLFTIQSKMDAHNSVKINVKVCLILQAIAPAITLNSVPNWLDSTD